MKKQEQAQDEWVESKKKQNNPGILNTERKKEKPQQKQWCNACLSNIDSLHMFFSITLKIIW